MLVGPATATLCLTVVVTVQAFLFADGGVSALGTNVLLMGVVAVWVGYGAFRVALPCCPGGCPASASRPASVPSSACPCRAGVRGALRPGRRRPIPLAQLAAFMTGWHVLIGVGEAAITVLAVSSVVDERAGQVRPAVRLPGLEQRDDVRVAEPRGGLGLPTEPVAPAGVAERFHHLEGDLAVKLRVVRPVDDAKGTFPEFAADLVPADCSGNVGASANPGDGGCGAPPPSGSSVGAAAGGTTGGGSRVASGSGGGRVGWSDTGRASGGMSPAQLWASPAGNAIAFFAALAGHFA